MTQMVRHAGQHFGSVLRTQALTGVRFPTKAGPKTKFGK